MVDKVGRKNGLSEVERRAIRLLAEGWQLKNGWGPCQANSRLLPPPELHQAGRTELALSRGSMAHLRDRGLIEYQKGDARCAVLTRAGIRLSQQILKEESDGNASAEPVGPGVVPQPCGA